MGLTKRHWVLIGILVLVAFAGGIFVYLGWSKQKSEPASSRSEQTQPESIRKAEGVIVKFNRSLILGKVEKVERDFPDVKITAKVVKSQSIGNYANFVKEGQVIEIQPNYFGKGFADPSFFEDPRNIVNLQGYFFLSGDYFVAEASIFGDERGRGCFYFSIQRITKETLSKEMKNLEEFLKENGNLFR